jgi:CubicO group peptidase (beta-lactamase class C family)
VESGAVPQIVAVAADRDGIIYQGAAGPRVPGTDDPVGLDSVFRIASMTKTVVTVAALQQVERGKLDLDSPVSNYVSEFAGIQVLEGFDGDSPRTRAPSQPATVRHLITHTSGLGYWFFNADILRWEKVTGTPNVLVGSDEHFSAPMVADPGTRFEYGINTDWLGRVVEATSGTELDDYLATAILAPLRMTSTGFRARPEDRDRTVPVHVHGPDGAWVPTPIDLNQAPAHWPGGHGLYSTPRDYLAFQQMLLRGGEHAGERILSTATVAEAFRAQIGSLGVPTTFRSADPASSADFTVGPDRTWGHGLLLNTRRTDGMRAAGSGGWAGLFNSYFWVDPASGITGAVYSQFLPFAEKPAIQVYEAFERALYAAP